MIKNMTVLQKLTLTKINLNQITSYPIKALCVSGHKIDYMTSCDSLTQSQSLKCTQVKFSCADQESDLLHSQYHFFLL